MKRCTERAEISCPNYPELCNKCGAYREPTNADRIRAMSDEELAEFLCSVYDDDFDKRIEDCTIPYYDQYSIKEWLKQPAEEDD